MASQHPDHANKPYWLDREFIRVGDETEECYRTFSELGISEYKWDWEGKFVDESVVERLLSQYYEYFKKNPLGKETFLTFRLPNPKVETEFRLGRAVMGMVSAAGLAKQVGLHSPPLFEVILPMTESAVEMIAVQEAFAEITSLKHPLLKIEGLKHVELIPLFEDFNTIIKSDEILEDYITGHKWIFGSYPKYMRPYVARSDPALNAGIVPTVLSIKIALSHYRDFEKKFNIPMFPIIGAASLSFRGGLAPNRIEKFVNEYQGVRTTLIQSAFRYDYPLKDVKKAIAKLNELLPKKQARHITHDEEDELVKLANQFEVYYKGTIEGIADVVNHIASQLPKRRERVQHIGLFGYSRGVGKVKLPRAIGFTAALYSLGIPPELIGTGRGIKYATENGGIDMLEKHYLHLKDELQRSGRYLNKEVLYAMGKKAKVWKEIEDDVRAVEKYLGEDLGPVTPDEKEHQKLTTTIHQDMQAKKPLTDLIVKAALLRKSMG